MRADFHSPKWAGSGDGTKQLGSARPRGRARASRRRFGWKPAMAPRIPTEVPSGTQERLPSCTGNRGGHSARGSHRGDRMPRLGIRGPRLDIPLTDLRKRSGRETCLRHRSRVKAAGRHESRRPSALGLFPSPGLKEIWASLPGKASNAERSPWVLAGNENAMGERPGYDSRSGEPAGNGRGCRTR